MIDEISEKSENEVFTVEKFKKQFENFESATVEERRVSEQVRDHRDLKQWTGRQLKELNRRGDAPIVVPKIAAKVDFLMGLERQGRTDPRAYPRNPDQDAKGAEAITDALRFVADNAELDEVASEVFEHACLVEGYAAAIIEPVMKGGQVEIAVNFIPWDRFYFDPHSRDRYFRDAAYMGIVVWMDLEDAKRRYPEKADEIMSTTTSNSHARTHDDRPKWVDRDRRRVKVCQHFFRHDGVWHQVHFTENAVLKEAEPSKLLDEYGEPANPIEAVHGYITRNNERYGFAKSLLGLEMEIIHRRQKALHALSTNQIIYEEGALKDPRRTAEQLKKPDGAVPVPAGSLTEGRVQIRTNGELAMGQVELLREASADFESRGASSMAMDTETGMSGRALRTIDANRKMEIGPLMDAHRKWKCRVYRQIWNRIKQFWDEERWIRVTDDEENLKWVGFNHPVTIGEKLKEKAQEGDQHAQMMLQQMLANQDPRLNEVHEIRNNIPELDVDIILDEVPDSVTVQQEQFEMLLELAGQTGQPIPFEVAIEMSSIRNKDQIIEKLRGDPAQQQAQAEAQAMQEQLAQMAAQLGMAKTQAEVEEIKAKTMEIAAKIEGLRADTAKTVVEVEQTQLENATIANFPDVRPSVIV